MLKSVVIGGLKKDKAFATFRWWVAWCSL